MATWVVGDVQGCYREWRALVRKMGFVPGHDTMVVAGDLVNRGPDSLSCLRWAQDLGSSLVLTLGNHDLACLALWYTDQEPPNTMQEVWAAEDAADLFDWLRRQKMLWHTPESNVWVSHAGLPPCWSFSQATSMAGELESALRQPPEELRRFFASMWGDRPACWDESLHKEGRLRYAVNALTRMRMMSSPNCLELAFKGHPKEAPRGLRPWFSWWAPLPEGTRLLFGHWAALKGRTGRDDIIGLDTGCVWGGALTAIRLQDFKIIQVDAGLS